MKFLLALTTLFLATHVAAQPLPRADSLQLHSMITDWDTAWETKDAALASEWYAQDARFTNAFGDARSGQGEVHALLREVFALPFVMSGKSETRAHAYQPLDANNVLVHTAVSRKGQRMPDGTLIPDRRTTHLRVFQRTRSGWLIKAHLISDARDKGTPKH